MKRFYMALIIVASIIVIIYMGKGIFDSIIDLESSTDGLIEMQDKTRKGLLNKTQTKTEEREKDSLAY